jgi:hypothetical protein
MSQDPYCYPGTNVPLFAPAEMRRIFEELEDENFLHGRGPDEFAARLTYY